MYTLTLVARRRLKNVCHNFEGQTSSSRSTHREMLDLIDQDHVSDTVFSKKSNKQTNKTNSVAYVNLIQSRRTLT